PGAVEPRGTDRGGWTCSRGRRKARDSSQRTTSTASPPRTSGVRLGDVSATGGLGIAGAFETGAGGGGGVGARPATPCGLGLAAGAVVSAAGFAAGAEGVGGSAFADGAGVELGPDGGGLGADGVGLGPDGLVVTRALGAVADVAAGVEPGFG